MPWDARSAAEMNGAGALGMSGAAQPVPPAWERAGRLIIGCWLSLFGWVGAAGSIFRILHEGSGPGGSALVGLGLGLVWILAGAASFRGRFVPAFPLLLLLVLPVLFEEIGTEDAPASAGPRTQWRDAADQLLASMSLLWLLSRWLCRERGFRRLVKVVSVGLSATFLLCLPPFSEGIGIALASLLERAPASRPLAVGAPVPAFRVLGSDGESWAFPGDDRLQVILFWATWCAPCLEELPDADHLAAQYADVASVTFIAVNTEGLSPAELRRLRASRAIRNLRLGTLTEDSKSRLEINEIPLVWVIREGTLIYTKTGYGQGGMEELENILEAAVPRWSQEDSPAARLEASIPKRRSFRYSVIRLQPRILAASDLSPSARLSASSIRRRSSDSSAARRSPSVIQASAEGSSWAISSTPDFSSCRISWKEPG